ncbi:MAG TPA: nucleoside triphosphate pyrophosphohydrolase [Gemmatimonadaceae bacterium]|nr:nucleoside triphosphate pyrophosphohydrolase [Gemmatimonadaceae bacterium]
MQPKATLEDTLHLMRDLRARCEWDAAQTHDSLRPYLIEEAHELDDALRDLDRSKMREELGDVLLQVLFHSVIAEEEGTFTVADVARGLIEKMERRHPHLYGDGVRVPWEQLKAEQQTRTSLEEGLPVGLPALHRAHRLQDRAAGVGFDWDDVNGPADKVAEEMQEVRQLLRSEEPGARSEALEAELGDLLFAVVNLCRKAGAHPALALDKANAKFARRFAAMERLAAERGIDVATAGLTVLDGLWDEVKASEPSSR